MHTGWGVVGGRVPMLNDEAERTMLFLHVWGHPAPAFHRAHGLCARAALRRVPALPSSQHLLCWLLPWQLVFHTFLGCKANRLMQSLPISTWAGAQSSHQGRRPLPQHLLSLLGCAGWCRWPLAMACGVPCEHVDTSLSRCSEATS